MRFVIAGSGVRVPSPALTVTALGKRPERADEAEPVEDRLVLAPRARPPVRIQPRIPPRVREVAQRLGRNGRARRSRAEPACDVLLRPEEVHRASGEHDVVPPAGSRDEAVEEEIRAVGALVRDADRIGLAAVRARRLDTAVDTERAENAEGIPGAVRIPT